jgi:DNA repair exonuclease SbcCD nuclease subunit
MKILCLADLHLTEKKPQCRPDEENWMETVERKLDWITDLIHEQKVDTVVIAGDIFDSTNKMGYEFMNTCLLWFNTLNSPTWRLNVVTIPGNHDLVNADHSRIVQSPYGVLVSTNFTRLPETIGFGTIPYGEDEYVGYANIVVGHYGLWHKEKPFKDAPDEGNVEWFVKNCLPKTCKLFITGHYHVPFVAKVNGTTVVNCGCPFRMRADLINYKPTVTIADVDSDFNVTTETFEIPLEYEIRRDYIDDKKDRETALDEMVGNIEGDFEAGFNFRDNFFSMSKECENSTEINKEFERCANGYYN